MSTEHQQADQQAAPDELRPASPAVEVPAEPAAEAASPSDEPSHAPPASGQAPGIEGGIDGLDGSWIGGWASAPGRVAVESLQVLIDGIPAAKIEYPLFRADLQAVGIGDGNFAFKAFPYRDMFDGQEHVVSVVGGASATPLAGPERRIVLPDLQPQNANPWLRLAADGAPVDWKREVPIRSHFLIERVPQGQRDVPYDAYTRLQSADPTASNGFFGITQLVPAPATSGERNLRIVARAVTPCTMVVRIGHEGSTRDEPIPLTGAWRTFVLSVPPSGELAISVGFKHQGPVLLDLALCAVLAAQVPTPVAGDRIPAAASDAANGRPLMPNPRFELWPKGIRFQAPDRGSELAGGWYFDCTAGENKRMRAELVQLRPSERTKPGAVGLNHGIHVSHQLQKGYSRISTALDLSALFQARSLRIVVQVGVDAQGTTTRLQDLMLVGRTVGTSVVLWTKSLDTLVDQPLERIEVEIPAAELHAIRARLPAAPSVELALQWTSAYEVTLFGVDIEPGHGAPVATDPVQPELTIGVEDPVVSGQVGIIRMLEDWGKPVEPRPKTVRAGLRAEVVVPVFNAQPDVRNCLESLVRADDGTYQVVVVDDGSGPLTARFLDWFAERHPLIRLLRNPVNLGYTKTTNVGIRATSAPAVIILNSDTIVPRGWVDRLFAASVSGTRIGMVSPLSNAASWQSIPRPVGTDGKWCTNTIPGGMGVDGFDRWIQDRWKPTYPEVPLVNGFCQWLDRAMLDDIGLYDEQAFPIGYGEETDLCLRATQAGWKLVIADDLYVFHAKSRSFGSARRSDLSKRGGDSLGRKHPGADLVALQAALRENTSLVELRNLVEHACYGGVRS